MKGSFYWHDYETFGTDPSRDRPVQFAGLRTDAELNVISEPLLLYCKPARDVLPHPQACLLTGITPQKALQKGLCEAEFIARIHAQLALPGTCGVGYNSIAFDDEVTRYTLYRNFHDPYEREYRDGNSRWDIIDLLRLAYALRPQGLVWPRGDDGRPSFKLEALAQANDIAHEAAHDALSDVNATIALARLVKQQQPRLFDHVLAQRGKSAVAAMLDIPAMRPVLHISRKFGAARSNIGLVAPVARHPSNSNEVICVDLLQDPAELAGLSVEQIDERLFTPAADLPEGMQRPGIKNIRTNRCPIVLTPRLLDAQAAQRLEIDLQAHWAHAGKLKTLPGLGRKLQEVFAARQFPVPQHPDQMLYNGGFFNDADRRAMAWVRDASPEQLRDELVSFEDPRLPQMLFLYRARNYPESLDGPERELWEEYRFRYLTDPEAGASLCLEQYLELIERMRSASPLSSGEQAVLDALLEYSDRLLV